MAVSVGSGEYRRSVLMPLTMTSAATRAPRVGLPPMIRATAMPGRTPWARASPRKLSPRSTTHVPMIDVDSTASSAGVERATHERVG